MQHMMLVLETSLAESLYPFCGEYTFWCIAGLELVGPVAVLLALTVLWRSLA